MCNTKQEHESSLNILLYRMDKLEEERKRENKDIMNLLQLIQEGQSEINKTMAVHERQLLTLEHEIEELKHEKVDEDTFHTQYNTITSRLDIYKQILMAVAGGVGVSLLIEFFKII